MFQLSGRTKGAGFYRQPSFEVNELIMSRNDERRKSYSNLFRGAQFPGILDTWVQPR